MQCDNFTDHFFNSCIMTERNRNYFWNAITQFPVSVEAELHRLSDDQFSNVMLGANLLSIPQEERHFFILVCAQSWFMNIF